MASGRRLSLRIGKSRVEIAPKDSTKGVESQTPAEEIVAEEAPLVETKSEPQAQPDSEYVVESDSEGIKRLGEMLVDEGVIDTSQLDHAIAVQQVKGGFLGRILVELGHCTEEQITTCLVKQYHIPYYNLNEFDIDNEVLSLIPAAICKKYKVIPIDRLGSILTVALLAPFDQGSLEAAQTACPDLKVKPILCNYEQFVSIIERIEGKPSGSDQKTITMESLGIKGMHQSPKPNVEFDSRQHDSGVFDSDELVAIIQTSMQKAIDDLHGFVKQNLTAQTSSGTAGVSAEQLSAAVQEALAENNKQLLEEVKNSVLASVPVLTKEDIHTAVQEQIQALHQDIVATLNSQSPGLDVNAVSDAVAKTIQPIVETHTQKALDEILQASRSPESVVELNNIARGIQKEISTVMDELMNAFSSQLKPIMTLLKSDDKFERHETLIKSIYDNIREQLEKNHKDLGGYQAQFQELQQEMRTSIQESQGHMGQSTAQFEQIQAALQNLENKEQTLPELQEMKGQLSKLDGIAESLGALESSKEQLAKLDGIAESLGILENVKEQLAKLDGIAESLNTLDTIKEQLAGEGGVITGVQALDQNKKREQDEDDAIAQALSRDINPEVFSFDSYHAAENTQETVNWCKHVAEKPGGGMPPLFLHGSPGTGKTHLVCATANALRKKNAKLRVGYVHTAQFAATYLDMLHQGSLDDFRAHFSHWDVLIIEDIQGLAHRPELQHELLQLLYVFTRNQRQLILTATEPVTNLPGFDYRVQSHLSACSCLLVGPPNWQQRLAILKQENESINAPLNDELLGLIAMNIPGNIRNLIGALHQAKAYAERKNIKLTNEHADDLIRHITQG